MSHFFALTKRTDFNNVFFPLETILMGLRELRIRFISPAAAQAAGSGREGPGVLRETRLQGGEAPGGAD